MNRTDLMARVPMQTAIEPGIAKQAREMVEAKAKVIRESRTAYTLHKDKAVFHSTVCNGAVKQECMPGEGHVATLEEVPTLLAPFVKACLGLRGRKTTLVWRRLPAVESDENGYKLTARLSWL